MWKKINYKLPKYDLYIGTAIYGQMKANKNSFTDCMLYKKCSFDRNSMSCDEETAQSGIASYAEQQDRGCRGEMNGVLVLAAHWYFLFLLSNGRQNLDL